MPTPPNDKRRTYKILNYPPGEGLNPSGTSAALALEQAALAGAKAAQQSKASTKEKEDKTS